MKKILVVVLFLMSFTAHAEWAISYGEDQRHDKGSPYTELRYLDLNTPVIKWDGKDLGVRWSGFIGTHETIGAEIFYPYKNWEFGWGFEHSEILDAVVETTWKYQIRIGYNFTENWSLDLLHKSNCRDICRNLPMSLFPHGPEGKSNKGINYLSAMYRF